MIGSIRPILLVEDSALDAEMTCDALRGANVVNPVVHVEDGVEALDYLFERGAFVGRSGGLPAVVLLDIRMPRLDGIDTLREIRAHDVFRRLPVVILTSSREERDMAASWDLGVNAYVVKPVDAPQFFEAVRTLGQFWALINQSAN